MSVVVNSVKNLDIILPFYGSESLFRAAVRSVLGQTDPRWRLVVVDDQYPSEEPGAWIRSLGDPRVHYVRNSTNLGLNRNFQHGLDLVEADFFVLLGCDDLMHPRYVERMFTLIEQHPDAAMIQPGVEIIDENGVPRRQLTDRVKGLLAPRKSTVRLSGEALAISLLRGNWTYHPSLCMCTAAAKEFGFTAGLSIVLDLDLLLNITRAGGVMVIDHQPVFAYRRHGESSSSKAVTDGTRFAEEAQFFAGQSTKMSARGWPRAARAARIHLTSRLYAATAAAVALRSGDLRVVRRSLAHVLR